MPATIKALPPLTNKLSIRVYQHILQAGRPVPSSEMLHLVQPEDCTGRRTPGETLCRVLCALSRARIDNIGTRSNGYAGGGLWRLSVPETERIEYAASVAAAAAAKATLPVPLVPAPVKWVGQAALPPQYDVMRAPVYVPPSVASARPGADDHLKFKSAGHLC